MTVLERSEHIAEAMRLTAAAQVAPHGPRKAGQQPPDKAMSAASMPQTSRNRNRPGRLGVSREAL
jgi:hypothetical protein